MNAQKNLLVVLGAWWDGLRRRSSAAPGRWGRLARWLLPSGGMLLIAALILTQWVWAGPGGNPLNGAFPMILALEKAPDLPPITGFDLADVPQEIHPAVIAAISNRPDTILPGNRSDGL